MTREEVIKEFPKDVPIDNYMLVIVLGFLGIILILFSIRVFDEHVLGKKMSKVIWSILSIGIVLALFSITTYVSFAWIDHKYPELKAEWKHNIFTSYYEGLEEIKVPIFQTNWNNEGKVNVILDTDTYPKTFSGIRDFQHYVTDDLNDKGYVLLKDLGNINDFPLDSGVRNKYNSIELVDIFLPKRELETK